MTKNKDSPAAPELERLREELAASQAREEKLREGLMAATAHLAGAASAYEKFVGRAGVRGHADALFTTRYSDFEKALVRSREALDLPHDDSALKERLARERERCAQVCEARRRTISNGKGLAMWSHDPASIEASCCADALRALGDKVFDQREQN